MKNTKPHSAAEIRRAGGIDDDLRSFFTCISISLFYCIGVYTLFNHFLCGCSQQTYSSFSSAVVECVHSPNVSPSLGPCNLKIRPDPPREHCASRARFLHQIHEMEHQKKASPAVFNTLYVYPHLFSCIHRSTRTVPYGYICV